MCTNLDIYIFMLFFLNLSKVHPVIFMKEKLRHNGKALVILIITLMTDTGYKAIDYCYKRVFQSVKRLRMHCQHTL